MNIEAIDVAIERVTPRDGQTPSPPYYRVVPGQRLTPRDRQFLRDHGWQFRRGRGWWKW